ncbi:GNAT family N-acetyltransferase [Nocardioides sp. LHG3406-4]|uniref:GNAT family N-acetyltransferase n=1 Tax=Nocardioides sp. LHG3406-4 TaxID=2804575 RepID=UPI003CEE4449
MQVTLTGVVDGAGAAELWPVYDAVLGDQPDLDTWRASVWDRHVAREGFRLARASSTGDLVGFAYGYTGERGQWWSDRAVEVLPDDVAAEWIGGHFEVVSIGVLAAARGRGLGQRLMTALTAGLPHERLVLMTTADAADPARRLYARLGWEVLGPGLRDDQVIMGRRRSVE